MFKFIYCAVLYVGRHTLQCLLRMTYYVSCGTLLHVHCSNDVCCVLGEEDGIQGDPEVEAEESDQTIVS